MFLNLFVKPELSVCTYMYIDREKMWQFFTIKLSYSIKPSTTTSFWYTLYNVYMSLFIKGPRARTVHILKDDSITQYRLVAHSTHSTHRIKISSANFCKNFATF